MSLLTDLPKVAKAAKLAEKAAEVATETTRLVKVRGVVYRVPGHLDDEQAFQHVWNNVLKPKSQGGETKIELPSELPKERQAELDRLNNPPQADIVPFPGKKKGPLSEQQLYDRIDTLEVLRLKYDTGKVDEYGRKVYRPTPYDAELEALYRRLRPGIEPPDNADVAIVPDLEGYAGLLDDRAAAEEARRGNVELMLEDLNQKGSWFYNHPEQPLDGIWKDPETGKYFEVKEGDIVKEVSPPFKPKSKKMEPGYYQRDDGTYFEVTDKGEVIEHGS